MDPRSLEKDSRRAVPVVIRGTTAPRDEMDPPEDRSDDDWEACRAWSTLVCPAREEGGGTFPAA